MKGAKVKSRSQRGGDDVVLLSKASGLPIDDNLLNETEALISDINTLYVKLIQQRAEIRKDRIAAATNPDANINVKVNPTKVEGYRKSVRDMQTLQKQLEYLRQLLVKHLTAFWGVAPNQEHANWALIENTPDNSRILALAGYLPDQTAISRAIATGKTTNLRWLANSPWYLLPDQNNINLAQFSGEWDILGYFVAPPYNRRPNNDKVIIPNGITIYPDIESFYRIGKKLGEGSFGQVYRATDPNGRPVALKLLNPLKVNRPQLEQEITLLTDLSSPTCNPNVVCYYGMFDASFLGKPVMVVVMEYVKGTDIDKALERYPLNKPLPVNVARPIVAGLLSGLKYMHDRHIYHLDIKEANVLLSATPGTGDPRIPTLRPVYIDLGLGCRMDGAQTPASCDIARTGGSRFYMSRDRLICMPRFTCTENDFRTTDIWSLGIMLYQILVRKDLPDDLDDYLKRVDKIQEYVATNEILYPLDPHINDVLRLALSGDKRVSVDDLISVSK